ncbi:MAG: CPBP family intramembrane metalloprotease [Armatimonadetes bacterium]|nr:CPBP family intramembrane metalloprotease [Armatimonadota bacterium]MDW8152780.1 CPBP family intramembrane glutamic endopeptidase [Armatimonadota bacterium]
MDGWIRLGFAVLLAVAAWVGAAWVYRDGLRRGMGKAALAWALATVVLFPALFPVYVLVVRPRLPGEQVWDLSEVLAVASLVIVTLPLGVSLAGGLRPDLPSLAGAVLAQSAVFLGGCGYVVRLRYGLPLRALGYDAARWPVGLRTGLLVAAAVIPTVHLAVQPASRYLLGLLLGQDRARWLAEQEEAANPILQALPPLSDPGGVVAFALLVAVLVPVAEETFFRGFVYPPLRRHYGARAAAWLSAVFFAAVHLQVVNFLPILLLGVVLAAVYERTGSLLPAVVVHAANNLVALISAYAGR